MKQILLNQCEKTTFFTIRIFLLSFPSPPPKHKFIFLWLHAFWLVHVNLTTIGKPVVMIFSSDKSTKTNVGSTVSFSGIPGKEMNKCQTGVIPNFPVPYKIFPKTVYRVLCVTCFCSNILLCRRTFGYAIRIRFNSC